MLDKQIVTIFDDFGRTLPDKTIIPDELKATWLKRAVGRYVVELSPLDFDEENLTFNEKLSRYTIDTLITFMKELYQEREFTKANKRLSVVTKELSVDGSGYTKKYSKEELDYYREKSALMVHNQKPTAYI